MEHGELHVAAGPMCAGKTTYLMSNGNSHIMCGFDVVYINSIVDVRSDTNISTHNVLFGDNVEEKFSKEQFRATKVSKLADASDLVEAGDVVLIDEAQFFPDLVETVCKWVDDQNKIVFVAGLNSDFKRQPFGSICQLLALADSVQILHSYCKFCEKKSRQKAIFTTRLTSDADEIIIGGTDIYAPVCRYHYIMSHHLS